VPEPGGDGGDGAKRVEPGEDPEGYPLYLSSFSRDTQRQWRERLEEGKNQWSGWVKRVGVPPQRTHSAIDVSLTAGDDGGSSVCSSTAELSRPSTAPALERVESSAGPPHRDVESQLRLQETQLEEKDWQLQYVQKVYHRDVVRVKETLFRKQYVAVDVHAVPRLCDRCRAAALQRQLHAHVLWSSVASPRRSSCLLPLPPAVDRCRHVTPPHETLCAGRTRTRGARAR
jgi:hypothetical protein